MRRPTHFDPTVPVHQQRSFVAARGQAPGCRHYHAWYHYPPGGVECAGAGGCRRTLLRLNGRGRYRGRHRA